MRRDRMRMQPDDIYTNLFDAQRSVFLMTIIETHHLNDEFVQKYWGGQSG